MRNGQHISIACILIGATCLCMVFSDHVCFIGTVYSNDIGSLRWVLPYQDPCVCTAIRPGGHLPYKPATGHYLEGLFLSDDSDEIRKFFACPVGCDTPQPLGIEHGTPLVIEDEDFTASSLDLTGTHQTLSAASARLNYIGGPTINGGWRPSDNNNAWIQVQLGRNAIVSGVITQGRDGDGDGSGRQQWVTQFKVMYIMMENSNLVYVKSQDGTVQIFVGNTEGGNTQVTNLFWQPVLGNSIRIVPTAYEGAVILRFELLGCLP